MSKGKNRFHLLYDQLKNLKINRKTFVFGLFLAISTVLWLLNALNKEYTHTINYPVVFKNLPDAFQADNELPDKLRLEVHGHGYDILSYKIDHSKPPVIVNLEKYVPRKISDEHFFLTGSQLKPLATARIKGKLSLNSVKPDSLHLYVTKIISRKLSVKSQLSFKPARQYMITGGPFLKPDSITVSGSKREIDKLTEIPTASLDYGKIDSDINRYIPLNIPDNIKAEPKRVKLNIFVEKYTESKLTIPVTVINLPDSLNIELIPSEINLSFQVPVSKYKHTSVSDFRIQADFKQKKDNILFPELVLLPDYIQHIRLHTEKIKFILSKNNKE